MADTSVNETPENDETTGDTSAGGFKPITSQDELNRIIGGRLEAERKKFADYGDLQTKAKRLDEIEEANKSEIQRAQDALAAAEAERDQARIEALRFRVATKHGISDEDAELFLLGSDEETLTKQAERLAERAEDAQRPRSPRPDPNQGRKPDNGGMSAAEQFAVFADAAFQRS